MNATISGMGSVTTQGIAGTGGDPVNGNYYYALTGTVRNDMSSYIQINFSTMLTNSSWTGINASGRSFLDLDYRLNASDALFMRIYLYDPYGNPVHYDAPLANDNAWHNLRLTISAFTGSVLPSAVISNLGVFMIQLISATTGSPANINTVFCADNVKMTN